MQNQDPFDRVLVAARAGEGWALAELFQDLHPRIRRYLSGYEPEDADDLTSDTWLDVVRALDRFRGDAAELRAFAFSIARTRLAEFREAREHEARRGAIDPVSVVTSPLPPSTPLDAVPGLAGLDTELALDRILALPAEDAEVILLRVLGGLSIQEVARTLDQPSRTVRAIQQRALLALAESMSTERMAP